MGNCCTFCEKYKKRKNVTILVTGLDNAGKTTIVKRLIGEPIDSVLRTNGFSFATLKYHGYNITLYDLGGGVEIRDIWNKYFMDAHGLIFVVDASNINRLEESKTVFSSLLSHKNISGKPVLLLANKQDEENALDEYEIVEYLHIERVVNKYHCLTKVELCSALVGGNSKIDLGIKNGFTWLIDYVIQDFINLNNRVQKDVANYDVDIQKDRDAWKARIAAQENNIETIDVPLDNGFYTELNKNVEQHEDLSNRITEIHNGSVSEEIRFDHLSKRMSRSIDLEEHITNHNVSVIRTITSKEKEIKMNKSAKLAQLYRRHKKKFGRFNRIAPMTINVLMREDSSENERRQLPSHSINHDRVYKRQKSCDRERTNYLVRRPTTAPARVHYRQSSK